MAKTRSSGKKSDPARKVLAPRTYGTRSHRVEKTVLPAVKKRRVYRLGNGLISLNKTPEELIPVAQANAVSPLLQLPAEIRNQIFEYALGGHEFIIFRKIASQPPKTRAEHLKAPNRGSKPYVHRVLDIITSEPLNSIPSSLVALLRVCRQVYSETATLVYKKNAFQFGGPAAFLAWRAGLKEAHSHAVTAMHFWDTTIHLPGVSYLSFPNLLTSHVSNSCKHNRYKDACGGNVGLCNSWLDEKIAKANHAYNGLT